MLTEAMLRKFDLNLLRVLDALFKEGSATRAAVRLGVSQPTVSLALGRLRELLGDPLFVKHAGGLTPTPRAVSLQGPVAAMLQILQHDILAHSGFDPAHSDRTFVFAIGEIGQLLYLDRIFGAMRAVAPNVRIKVVTAGAHEGELVLDASEADVAIGFYPNMRRPTHYQQRLYESRLVALARCDHPALAAGLSVAALGRLEQMILGGSDVYVARVDRELRKQGLAARVALELPNLVAAPHLLATTDLVAVVPESLARFFARSAAVAVVELPLALPPVSVKQYWHRRHKDDPANRWVRQIIVQLLQRPR